jgi:hypothetical protein
MAEETAKWQKLLDEDKEEQKKALAKNPSFEKRFAKLGLKESYTRPLDVVNFIKPGDSVLRNIYSFVSEKNPMLGIWTSGIVRIAFSPLFKPSCPHTFFILGEVNR